MFEGVRILLVISETNGYCLVAFRADESDLIVKSLWSGSKGIIFCSSSCRNSGALPTLSLILALRAYNVSSEGQVGKSVSCHCVKSLGHVT